jgi:hypothetical protein
MEDLFLDIQSLMRLNNGNGFRRLPQEGPEIFLKRLLKSELLFDLGKHKIIHRL